MSAKRKSKFGSFQPSQLGAVPASQQRTPQGEPDKPAKEETTQPDPITEVPASTLAAAPISKPPPVPNEAVPLPAAPPLPVAKSKPKSGASVKKRLPKTSAEASSSPEIDTTTADEPADEEPTTHTTFRARVDYLEHFDDIYMHLRRRNRKFKKRELFDEALRLLFEKYKDVLEPPK